MFLFTKYLVAAGMVLLLISHGIIQYGMFELVQMNHKTVIEKRINRGIPRDQRVVLKFEKNDYENKSLQMDWKDKDEFRLDGHMYDIINIEVTKDSVYLYCILDSKDSDLYSILDKLIKDDSENSDDENSLNNYFSHFYSCTVNQSSIQNYYSPSQYIDCISGRLLYIELPVTTPPPQA